MNTKLNLTLRFVVVVSVLMAAFSFVIYQNYVNYRVRDYNDRLIERSTAIAEMMLTVKQKDSISYFLASNNNLRPMSQHRISIFDEHFQLVSDSFRSVPFSPTELLQKIKSNQQVELNISDSHIVGFIVRQATKPYYVIATAQDMIGKKNYAFLGSLILVSFIFIMLLTAIAGWYLASKAMEPIKEVIEEVDKVTANSLSMRLRVSNVDDEISLLNRKFNNMLDRLEASFVMQRNFVSNASHEFRTPITAIKAQLEVMLMQERTKDEYVATLKSVQEDIDRFMDLMIGLSELSKANIDGLSNQNNKVPLIEVIAEVRSDLIRSKPRYRILLNISNLPEYEHENYIMGNESLLKAAFKNVMENACKFSPDQKCDVRIWFENGLINVTIKDEGIGIPPDELPHIFEPFFRSNEARSIAGHGLGLSLVKRIVDLHKGTIEVKSMVANGTELHISLPQAQPF